MNRTGWLVYTDDSIRTQLEFFPRNDGTTTETTNWSNVAFYLYNYHTATGRYARAEFVTYP